MSDAVTIRRATPEDAGAISALVESLAAFFLANPDDPTAAAGFFATTTPEALRAALTDGPFVYHVACMDGTVVGAVGLREGRHLYHLFVAERLHRQGLAARLWETARAEAECRERPDCYTVNATVSAVPVYERFGFRCDGPLREQDGIRFQPMTLLVPHRPRPLRPA